MYVPKYFKESEFQRLTPSCSISQMDERLLKLLDELREAVGTQLIITSAYRSADWDMAKGRSGEGAHTKGMGVDISAADSYFMRVILQHALRMPFTGIGIGKRFIHLDIMPREFAPLVWGY